MICSKCNLNWENRNHVAVVIPLYKSEANIPFIAPYLLKFQSVIKCPIKVIVVSDGDLESTVVSLAESLGFHKIDFKVIQLKRNYGVSTAIHEGLLDSNSCATIVIGADLQEPLNLLSSFVSELLFSDTEIVLGNRISRQENLISKCYSGIFWFFYRKLVDPTTPKGGFDVFGVSLYAKKQLDRFVNSRSFILGQVSSLSGTKKYVEFERLSRNAGKSSWSIGRKIALFFRVFLDYSNIFTQIVKILLLADYLILFLYIFTEIFFDNSNLLIILIPIFFLVTLMIVSITVVQLSNLQKNSVFMNDLMKRL